MSCWIGPSFDARRASTAHFLRTVCFHTIGNLENTANFGEIIILAINGKHAKQALETAGEENLNGKTIIDATNPIEDSSIDNGVLRFFTDINRSFMEELQEVYPEAHFVKAFKLLTANIPTWIPRFEIFEN